MSSIEFQRLRKDFGSSRALTDFSLSIHSGELVTLVGPSGCGKTTTLNLLAGFLDPDGGAILIDGKPIEHLPPHRRNTALVFQGYALFPHLTVAANVAFGLEIRKWKRDAIRSRVMQVLDIVQLRAMADRYPRALSGGQQQRVAIARALAIEPDVLLLDEPLSNLDAKLREEMRSQIRAIQKLTGITTMYVTHDQEEALSVSDRVVVMRNGAIEQVGTPQEIYGNPRTAFVADFVGAANLLPVTIRSCAAGEVRVETGDGLEFRVASASQPGIGSSAYLMIRPEHIRLLPRRDPVNSHVVTVADRAFLGAVNLLSLRLGELTLRVRAPGRSELDLAGTGEMYAHWSPSESLLIPAPAP